MIEWAKYPHILVRLRALWDEGHSSRECANKLNEEFRGLGATKNAVIGAAHRRHFPSRVSPIKRDGLYGPPTLLTWLKNSRRVYGPPTYENWLRRQRDGNRIRAPKRTLPKLKSENIKVLPVVIPVRMSENHPCCWPFGEPGTKDFRYCDAPGIVGRSYCPEHHRLAYVRSAPISPEALNVS